MDLCNISQNVTSWPLVQLIVMIGLDIVYCVTGGRAMKFVFDVSYLLKQITDIPVTQS